MQQVAPITITIENSQAYAPAAPACTLDMEVCPPTSGDLLMPREHDGTPLGKPW